MLNICQREISLEIKNLIIWQLFGLQFFIINIYIYIGDILYNQLQKREDNKLSSMNVILVKQ